MDKKDSKKFEVIFERESTADAEARLQQAFRMLLDEDKMERRPNKDGEVLPHKRPQ